MNILIIEDEQEAADRLKLLLNKHDQEIKILDVVDTVEGAVQWFRYNTTPDLVFLDIHLADGLCFDIFDQVQPEVPIIFTTAYDQYAIKAFKLDSIDYLLKPIDGEELLNALHKYRQRAVSFPMAHDYEKLTELLRPRKYKNRFMARSGQKNVVIESKEVAYFIAEEKNVYLIDLKNNKYTISATLDELERNLDPDCFFRINRGEIIQVGAIDFMEPYFNGREVLILNIPGRPKLMVSRRRVKELKNWI